MKWIETSFSHLLSASLASTVIILLLLLLRKLLYRHMGPKLMYVLWFLVLIKLLVPIAPQSSFSLFNWFPAVMQGESVLHRGEPVNGGQAERSNGAAAPAADGEGSHTDTTPVPAQAEASGLPSVTQPLQELSPEHLWSSWNGVTLFTISSLVWLGGIVVLTLYFLFAAISFRRGAAASRRLDDPEICSILEACQEMLGIRRMIPIYETSRIHSPCIHGLAKPGIYLPEDIVPMTNSSQLTHILLHELIHFQRKDLWFNLLWTLAVMLHWYNPIVWLAFKKMKTDREVACDARALEVLGEQEASAYGMTLLTLSRFFSRSASSPVMLTHFFKNRKEMNRRILMIAGFKKGAYKLSAAAILFVLCFGAVVLTDASESLQSPESAVRPYPDAEARRKFPLMPMDGWLWKRFSNVDRAVDFTGFSFKVPDYLPEGYQLTNFFLNNGWEQFPDNWVSISFASDFGQENEKNFQIQASKGNLLLLGEYSLVQNGETRSNAPASWGESYPHTKHHEEAVYAGVKGTLVITTKSYEHHEPEIEKSFIWQDGDVWYSIDWYREAHTKEGTPRGERMLSQDEKTSEEELIKMISSFRYPLQLQHVSYEGKGSSFWLYEEEDVLKAEQLLGTKVKYPLTLPNQLRLDSSVMHLAHNQNTGYKFKPPVDTLETEYRAYNGIYDPNDTLNLFQSRETILDVGKLTYIRTQDMSGISVSVYEDKNYIYHGPNYNGDETDIKSQTYYLWEQNNMHYTVFAIGIDKNQEENVKALLLAPIRK